MNLHWIDWAIVAGLFIVITVVAFTLKQYTRSVADFLAAGRCAKRYLLCAGYAMSGIGAIAILANWQMNYEGGGLVAYWWSRMHCLPSMILVVTGFCIYRYRQTRCMTMAQLFEVRYSKNFRIFAGIVGFMAGMINFGLFPAVGARFFMYYCGLPQTVDILGIAVSTYAMVLIVLLSASMMFIWLGGQIAVMVTDFIQYFFCNIVFILIVIFALVMINVSDITQALLSAPEGQSWVHPLKGGNIEEFNMWYYIIIVFGIFYACNDIAWQGSQGYFCSAISAHEAKMAKILEHLRALGMTTFFFLIPIIVYTLMHNPKYSSFASGVNGVLGTIENDAVRRQMVVPLALTRFLPLGLRGALCAAILAAFLSTHDTYMHSWGTMFVQDIIMPFRKKPFSEKNHMLILRLAIVGVAIFIFFFALLFRQTQAIYMYFQLTGTIYIGGAGPAIIGALYWKKGTTRGAVAAMITGMTIAITAFVLEQVWPNVYGTKFPITGIYVSAIAMAICPIVYITVSLLEKKTFNLDRMLHRGQYAIEPEQHEIDERVEDSPKEGFMLRTMRKFGYSKEFTLSDKIILWLNIGSNMGFFLMFIFGTVYCLIFDVSEEAWIPFWKILVGSLIVISIIVTIWISIGGWMDLKDMLMRLRTVKRNEKDDGMVIGHTSRDELPNEEN